MSKNEIQNGQQSLPKSEFKSLEKVSSYLKRGSKLSNVGHSSSITSESIKKSIISFKDKDQRISDVGDSTITNLPIQINSSNTLKKPPSIIKKTKTHFKDKNVTLIEDVYGKMSIGPSDNVTVKRFTWKNHNDIEVQIITYGARIISMKIPDKKGEVEDIVLGFDKLSNYRTNGQHSFGATIGRITGPIENSTFVIDGKQYWLNSSDGPHHVNGGCEGFDRVIWNSSVIGSKVVLTFVTPENHEGFPGQLFVETTFELSGKNEFHIDMEAKSTKPTIINLSNFCYFNLGGHHTGKHELQKHYVTVNSRSFVDIDENHFPTGQIDDSTLTDFEFQMPVLMKKHLDNKFAFDRHFCVNEDLGDSDDASFVARALHTPSGRTLEVYSNQRGLRFTTGNNINVKFSSIPNRNTVQTDSVCNTLFKDENILTSSMKTNPEENFMLLVNVYEKLSRLDKVSERDFKEILDLFKQIYRCDMKKMKSLFFNANLFKEASLDVRCFLTAVLQAINVVKVSIPSSIEIVDTWSELVKIVRKIYDIFQTLDSTVKAFTHRTNVGILEKQISAEAADSTLKDFETVLSEALLQQADAKINALQKEDSDIATRKVRIPSKTSQVLTHNASQEKELTSKLKHSSTVRIRSPPVSDNDITGDWLWMELQEQLVNYILTKKSAKSLKLKHSPSQSETSKIIGKGGVVYGKHAGMAFQTQNFPNAIYHKNFPNSVLRPGETYQHKIVYKFWVQSGSPKKWLKRYSESE